MYDFLAVKKDQAAEDVSEDGGYLVLDEGKGRHQNTTQKKRKKNKIRRRRPKKTR